jgi:hypothetical protein
MSGARSGLLSRPFLLAALARGSAGLARGSDARRRGRAERRRAGSRKRGPSKRGLVGRDLARARLFAPGRSHQLPLALLAILLAALALAALRIDIIRMRYRMTEAIHERADLLEEHRVLTAHVRSLRDPSRLARLARDRDLAWPEQVIEIEAGELQP